MFLVLPLHPPRDRPDSRLVNVAVSSRLFARLPAHVFFPAHLRSRTQPEADAQAAKGEVPADLPDAEEESLALVDAKVLEEEQKLREERKKAAEVNKTEVRQTTAIAPRVSRRRHHVVDRWRGFGADAT